MKNLYKWPLILIAEDDPDDQLLLTHALKTILPRNTLIFVNNGEELMSYLQNCGQHGNPEQRPQPDLILLDLNMPQKSGLETLAEIKSNSAYRCIPIVVLTNSSDDKDISSSYFLGANSFITKPASFESLTQTMVILIRYWMEIVRLPSRRNFPSAEGHQPCVFIN